MSWLCLGLASLPGATVPTLNISEDSSHSRIRTRKRIFCRTELVKTEPIVLLVSTENTIIYIGH